MTKHHLVAFALLLAAAPAADAHDGVFAFKDYCEDPSEIGMHDYGPSVGVFVAEADGNQDDCNGDGIPADYDGHSEFGYGGGVLTVAAEDPSFLGCAAEAPHHSQDTIFVNDAVVGLGIEFVVSADYDCDSIDDIALHCIGYCNAPFPPGADGAYRVFVIGGTTGHISTGAALDSPPTTGVGPGKPDEHAGHVCEGATPQPWGSPTEL